MILIIIGALNIVTAVVQAVHQKMLHAGDPNAMDMSFFCIFVVTVVAYLVTYVIGLVMLNNVGSFHHNDQTDTAWWAVPPATGPYACDADLYNITWFMLVIPLIVKLFFCCCICTCLLSACGGMAIVAANENAHHEEHMALVSPEGP